MSVFLRNPHSVLAALASRPEDVLGISVTPRLAESDAAWGRVALLARERGVPIVLERPRGDGPGRGPKPKGNRAREAHENPGARRPDEGGRVGVAEAEVRERRPVALEELFQGVRAGASEGSEAPGLWLALDCLQDPQNVGAIFRSAAFFGVRGILLTQERSVGLTSTVYDIASGGVEAVPFSVQVNLRQAFETAKAQGLWILGTSEHGRQDLFAVERDRPWLVVLGNEERGMRRLTEDRCDVICAIRPRGGLVTSLNVSVAAGIVISRMA